MTENVVVLFTDLVDSTKLAYARSPEAAEDLRRAHFALLRKAIAVAGGEEVKNLGDGLMVAFPVASSALSCAVAMQRGVEAHGRRSDEPLAIRIGVSAGEVTREEDDYFGDAVIEAARLCARAESGQILVAQLVQAMAGRRSSDHFRLVGPMELKGLSEPLVVVEVAWEPLADEEIDSRSVPLPPRLTYRPSVGMIGRESQLRSLEESFKRVAADGRPEVVLIDGEAGQGKTTLAAEAAWHVWSTPGEERATVLLGRCDEESGAPYAPFAEALQHYVVHAPEEIVGRHVAAFGPELARLAPALGDRMEGLSSARVSDAETDRFRLYRSVLGVLAQAAEDHPVVLVLDDLQWADAASLQLLRHLVKQAGDLRLLIIATYRDTELSPSHPLTETLAALRREQGIHRIKLKGLDRDEVLEYLTAAAGGETPSAGRQLAEAVCEETDGNPFFVSEVLRDLTESGADWQNEAVSKLALPNSVREVIMARVARIGPSATRILSLASVIGRDFDLQHLAMTAETDEDGTLDLLEAASVMALVREVPDVAGRYSFSHALVQHTLYQELGPTRRARAHRRVGETLEELCGDRTGSRITELAYHWFQATQLVDTNKALSYSRQAGEAALAGLAPGDAVRYFLQALQLLAQLPGADPTLGVDLRLDLGIAQRQAGIPAFRETLLEAAHLAQGLGDRDRLVRAALANNRGFFSALGVVDDERVAVLESALEMAPDGDSPDRAVLLATLCSELTYGPLDRRLELARQATDMAERLGDPATLIDVLNLQQIPLTIPSMLSDRLRTSARSVMLARELNDPVRLFWTAHFDRDAAVQEGDFARGTRHLEVMKTLAERLRQPMMVWVSTYHEAVESLIVGDHERAEELATLALEIGTESAQPDAFAFYGAQLIIVRIQQGRMDELAALVAEIAEQNPRIAAYQACVAASHLDAREDQEALVLLEMAAEDSFDWVFPDTAWFDAIAVYCRVATELSARGPAEHLIRLIEPYHDQIPFHGLTVHEPTSCLLGGLLSVVDRDAEAEGYLAEAMEVSRRGNMKFAQAQSQLAWGRMLARRTDSGDRERARAMLEKAHASATANGYQAIGRRAARSLEQLG